METNQVIAGLDGYMKGLCATLGQLDTAQLARIVAVLLRGPGRRARACSRWATAATATRPPT